MPAVPPEAQHFLEDGIAIQAEDAGCGSGYSILALMKSYESKTLFWVVGLVGC